MQHLLIQIHTHAVFITPPKHKFFPRNKYCQRRNKTEEDSWWGKHIQMNVCYISACPMYHSDTFWQMQKLPRTHGSATLSSVQLKASPALLAVLLPLVPVFTLTLQWQDPVTRSHVYMYSSAWLLPWSRCRSRVFCSVYWTSAIVSMMIKKPCWKQGKPLLIWILLS